MQKQIGKERRYVASDMSRAMRMLTDELGADAVLLSSRRVKEGVEVIGLASGEEISTDDFAALHSDRRRQERRAQGRRSDDNRQRGNQYSEQNKQEKESSALFSGEPSALGQKAASSLNTEPLDKALLDKWLQEDGSFSGFEANQPITSDGTNIHENDLHKTDLRKTASDLAQRVQALNDKPLVVESLEGVTQTLDQVKDMLAKSVEHQNGKAEDFLPQPNEYIVTNRLLAMGLSSSVAKALVQSTSAGTVDELWCSTTEKINKILPVVEEDLLKGGGVFALVGPKGAGKTSIIAKLLTQFALRGEAEDLAIISFDDGAQGAISRLAAVSGIPLLFVDKQYSLNDRIQQCAKRRLVLIDTSNDLLAKKYQNSLQSLEESLQVKEILVLPATGEIRYLQCVLKDYRSERSAACALTFFEQTHALGELMSLLLMERLNIAYLSEGTILPDKLTIPNKTALLQQLMFFGTSEVGTQIQMPIVNMPVERVGNHDSQ